MQGLYIYNWDYLALLACAMPVHLYKGLLWKGSFPFISLPEV